MPHAGLMNEQELGPEAGPFQRARLHLRGGRRRLRQGKTAAGIATLADALSAALEWYAASPERRSRLAGPSEQGGPPDDRALYALLVRSGVLDGKFDYDAFDSLTEYALDHELPGFDHGPVLAGIEAVMTQLGVMPFNEADLPAEDPKTF
ncbi:MAG: hypothetical protein ACYC7L_00630 [Nitrospirota bacterium]